MLFSIKKSTMKKLVRVFFVVAIMLLSARSFAQITPASNPAPSPKPAVVKPTVANKPAVPSKYSDNIDDRMKGPNGEKIFIGSNGGRYYLDAKGNKKYVPYKGNKKKKA
jgi:hypothetical protein